MRKLVLAVALLVVGARLAAADDAPAERAGEAADARAHEINPWDHINWRDFGWRDKDEFGGKFGDGKMEDPATGIVLHEEEPMSAPFVLMMVNFIVFLAILAKWGWPVASRLAADRHDQIKSALDEAAALRKKAADKLAEYETRIKDLDSEIKKLVEGVRADAAADKQRMFAAAEAQAAQMKRDAELRIAAEIELARTALTREVAAAAVAATEKLLREKVGTADQRRLVSAFIIDIGKGKEAR